MTGIRPRMLDVQYRMHPQIASICVDHCYKGLLRTDNSTMDRPSHFRAMEWVRSSGWWSSTSPTLLLSVQDSTLLLTKRGSSKANFQHQVALLEVVRKLLVSFDPAELLVISAYRTQVFGLRRLFLANDLSGVEITTVDGSQGSERTVVVFDLVSPCTSGASVGFLKAKNRVNVAMSRAKDLRIVVGHEDMRLLLATNENGKAMLSHFGRVHTNRDHKLTIGRGIMQYRQQMRPEDFVYDNDRERSAIEMFERR
jgi:superfamily I DNA and/or RNA helicase